MSYLTLGEVLSYASATLAGVGLALGIAAVSLTYRVYRARTGVSHSAA